MDYWKVLILCWLSVSIGFVIGAAWCGLFRGADDPGGNTKPQTGSMPGHHPQ